MGVSGLTTATSLSIRKFGTSIGVPIAGCCSLLAGVARMFANEFFSKLKFRCTKLNDWTKLVITK